jgi:VWFA-related protein
MPVCALRLDQGAAGASPAAIPPPPPPPGAGTSSIFNDLGEAFAESVDVNVVNVEVVVRDNSGHLVPGLTRADFKLLVDGRQVELTNFSAAGAPSAPPVAIDQAPNGASTTTPAAGRESLNLVVFVDNANMRPFDRNRLLKQLRAFLQSTLRPGDRVLVVTHEPGLHVRHQFGDDLSTLASTLGQLEKESATGLNRDISERQTLEQLRDLIRTSGCGNGFSQAAGQARADAESVLADARITYSNLHHLLRSLSGLEGRKALIYVGDGLATHAGTDTFGLLHDLCPTQGMHLGLESVDATAPMRQVIADANASLVTLYTLEARGLDAYVSAEHAGKPLLSFELTRLVAADRQDSLTNLARETGGRSALDGNDFSHDLEAIAAELGAAYSLGFTPARAGEGRTHQIRVELTRPGLRASYRTSYRDRTAQERLEGQVEAALIHGQADNPLAASLKVGAAVPAEHGRVLVAVQIRVPFAKLSFLPRDDGRHGRVNIVIGNIDSRGGMALLQRMQLPLRIPEADAKRILASHLGYDVKLLIEPGHQRLAFVVRDDLAHISSCVLLELEVDKSGAVSLAAMTAGGPAAR